MQPPDLDPIQDMVNSAFARYREALDSYVPDGRADARDIVDNFLRKWLDTPGRSEIGTAEAEEAIHLVKAFQEVETRFTEHVALLNMQTAQTVTHLQTELLAASIRLFATPDGPARFQRAGADALGQAASVGYQLVYVVRRAAMLLLVRQATLRTFSERELETSWHTVTTKLSKELKEVGTDVAADKAIEVLVEQAANVFGLAMSGVPLGILVKSAIKVIVGASTGYKIDFTLNATDRMQLLLQELREEDDLFNKMDALYNDVMDRFAALAKYQLSLS